MTFSWSTRLCPFCFRAFRFSDAPFVCPECRELDPVKQRHLGLLSPPFERRIITLNRSMIKRLRRILSQRACHPCDAPNCAQVSSQRVCPHCHSALPSGFAAIPSRVISVIGARDAGKTHFIAVLIHQLQHQAGRILNATLITLGDETRNLYKSHYDKPLFEQHKLLPPTNRAASNPLVRRPLIYRLEFAGGWMRRKQAVNLVFFDAAGEDLGDSLATELYCRYVLHASALIYLFDPLTFDGVFSRLTDSAKASTVRAESRPLESIDRVIELLEAHGGLAHGKPVEIPVAFALTKLDALAPLLDPGSCLLRSCCHQDGINSAGMDETIHEVRGCIAAWQPGMLDKLDRKFKNAGYFAVSSLGGPPQGSKIGSVSPVRIEDPLIWVLSQLGYVGKTG